jgi:hypothetical protein
MKKVLLVGSLGSRVSEEPRTKPMIEMGGKSILLHILRTCSNHGINNFTPEHRGFNTCNDPVNGVEWLLTQYGIMSSQLSWKDVPESRFNSTRTGGL